ncbi:ABC transporter substrate-binding protein [Methanosphaera cuniculi]|uniref:ABC transporter substrate-binding protein n=1 Tax=Methanosphaera cuniculi TaxID=1077256 RepID=UPI0026DA6EBB|nr:ABC transporter substrate-binding protein [Methanosphaera cuniculi]
MQKKNIKYLIIGLIALIIIIIAAASVLGNSTDTDPTHLVVAFSGHGGEPEAGFNPLTGWGCGHLNFNPLIQSTLLTSDENGTFKNDVATGYNVSSDGLTWTVGIRDDIKFSNNESLKASDVAFTFNEAKTSNSELDMSNLDHATAINDTTVEFKLKEPQSTFIYSLRYIGIVPEKDYDNETYGEHPIGSGPYKLEQWDKGQQAILVANDNYYGEKPYFKQLTLLFTTEKNSLEFVKSHKADVVEASFMDLNYKADGYNLVELKTPRAQGVSLPYMNDTGIKTDQGNPVGNNVTGDPAIRKALNIGINREEIVNSVYQGHASVDYTGVDSLPYANPEAKIQDNNPEEAKNILTQAGWVDTDNDGIREKDGTKASFKLYYSSEDMARQSLATVIKQQASEIGIDIELVGTDWDTIYQNMYSQGVLMQQSSQDPYKNIYQQYYSKDNFTEDDYMNPNEYNNSEVDGVLTQAMESTNLNSSNDLWKQAAYINAENGFGPAANAPWLWIADYDYCYFVNTDIDMGSTPSMGQDVMEHICEWKRTNATK